MIGERGLVRDKAARESFQYRVGVCMDAARRNFAHWEKLMVYAF